MVRELILGNRKMEECHEDVTENIKGIVLGDEGCVYKALDETVPVQMKQGLNRGFSIRFVTSFVPDAYIEAMYERIELLSKIANIKVTFNDYGLLYRCKKLIESERITAVLGRLLTHSIIDCPWHGKLLRHEPPELAKAVTGQNFHHEAKISLISDMGVREIEVNALDNSEICLDNWNIATAAYTDDILISVGRLCFAARWYDKILPECRTERLCERKIPVKLVRTWGKMKAMYNNPTEEVMNDYENLYVRGNIVYRERGEIHENEDEKYAFVIVR